MRGKRVGLAVLLCVVAGALWAADQALQDNRDTRDKLNKAYKAGNYKDAYEGLRKLALDPKAEPAEVGKDLNLAINCLNNLGRTDEIDEFREAVIAAHEKNWRLLHTAARSFQSNNHYGWIVAGKFYRGYRRGGTGKYVNTFQRDRTRALQLMEKAQPLLANEPDKTAAASFHYDFASILMQGTGFHESWRLQYLTDLGTLPDYEDGYYGWRRSTQGAPVDDKGNPVLHSRPESYEKADSDGQRWRWMLNRVVELAPNRANEVDMMFGRFLRSQFGVQTIGWGWRNNDDSGTGTYALHTLKDTETIARLATGLKRFSLPDEFNYIKVMETVAKRTQDQYGREARDTLASEFEDRRQYPKAADAWKVAIKEHGPGNLNHRQNRLNQIVNPWGTFEPMRTQPAAKRSVVDFRFRNGKKVTLEATAIKVEKLLADVKDYLKSNPANIDWRRTDVSNIGYRLVVEGQNQYLGEKVAKWDLDLKPRANHFDDRITVTTPLERSGAYLLTAKLEDGNMSRIIVWVSDTALIKKQLDNKVLYYAADAISGSPIPKANLEYFGWKTEPVAPNQPRWKVVTTSFARNTNDDGQVIVDAKEQSSGYNWLITATKPNDGNGGGDRLAYLGFNGVWYGQRYDPEYNATRVFTMTDRPVYRPDNKIQFKAWVRHAKYDQADTSDFANQDFAVTIRNAKGDKVFEKTLKTDEYAGLEGDLTLDKSATLGQYTIQVGQHWNVGHFRLEEYKKPEFEVKVDAPKEPIKLGDKFEATIAAKYYFGAPVTRGKVKYKVMRQVHDTSWYPSRPWDWFYGTGYWWFACDYVWYPGWGEWGCRRPIMPWWRWRDNEPPELVAENEQPIAADGVLRVEIDTTAAKELHGNNDHKYTITAEVVDESRRTIVGTGDVIVSRKPFRVHAWVDRGYYRAGDTVKASFKGLTPDRKPVKGNGEVTLFAVSYKDGKANEKAVQTWNVSTNETGEVIQQMKAAKAGQYRVALKLTDAKKNTIEGGYVFVVRGDDFTGKDFRFNDLELTPDRTEYAPGDKAKVLINTDNLDGTVLLFVRPTNGVYLAPKTVRIQGKSTVEEVTVEKKDMPNFFVEAMTVHGGRVHTEVREIVVPPEKRILNVEVKPDQREYKPGQKATVQVKLTDLQGQPFVGQTVLTVYDRSVDYISGGTNVPEIKEFFWKWRRSHYMGIESSLERSGYNQLKNNEVGMSYLGMFGAGVVDELALGRPGRGEGRGRQMEQAAQNRRGMFGFGGGGGPPVAMAPGAPANGALRNANAKADAAEGGVERQNAGGEQPGGQAGGTGGKEPTIRKNFVDTAVWKGALKTNADGTAEVSFTLPEQTTGWKILCWGMGHGTKVGQAETEVVTKKDVILRLQSPRFFTQKDEVVLSANVHNYLKTDKDFTVSLEVDGGTLEIMGNSKQSLKITAGGEKRVDWRVKVKNEGEAVVRMKAVTDEDSDAMQMRFPCYVHGMLKMESFSGVIRVDQKTPGKVKINVPVARRVEQTRLEIRYSPTLAGAMVDALPYMVDYPYGCTEQTLNRFLPTVITQRTLQRMKVDLKDVQQKRTNLNAQEIGNDVERAKQWKRYDRNPVFDEEEVKRMVNAGVQRLTDMQCSDGGWGWFSGFGEHSWPHTTAVVVHGLQIAKANDVALVPNMLERGVTWLENYQAQQVAMIENAPAKIRPWKPHADNLDALVYMVLADAGKFNEKMRDFLYRDRTKIGVYAKAMYGLALKKDKGQEKQLEMILQNISQYVVEDEENQSAYLRLPASESWWYWYGSEIEANAYYLKLLAATSPNDKKAAGLVKYLLNNRRHATYWNSTRDTALCIEAMADYLKASGEDQPDMTVEIVVDGQVRKEVKIDSKNLFNFDNKFVMEGAALADGEHNIEVRRKGKGPVYFNTYLTNFTLEDFITKAGLEVRVNRKVYKLERVEDAKVKVPGAKGQALDRKVEKFKRIELKNMDSLKSGDLVEVELEIDSKNDYEYLLFEDPRAAGFEPMVVRSGYGGNDMGAYMEVRDDRMCFFARRVPRGKHSIAYRMRAEIPGTFSSLPARAAAMYAPELKGNSDEIKLQIRD